MREHNRAEDAARVVTTIRRIDPTFDPQEFGTKFLSSGDLEHLRDGFRKAGLMDGDCRPRRSTASPSEACGRFWFALAMFAARSFWNSAGPAGAGLPKT